VAETATKSSWRDVFPRSSDSSGGRGKRVRLDPTSFVGREGEIERLSALLSACEEPERGRLVTVTGPGGVGKTRFALRVADIVSDRFRDGVVVVELAAIRDSGLVLSAIAHTLRLGDSGERPMSDVIAGALAHRHVLVVLDNAEQVVAAAPDIAALLAGCPGLSLLVTSRTPLRLRGEQRFPLRPLDLPAVERDPTTSEVIPDAMRLFEERARESNPGFVLDHFNSAAIASICRTLDGLPLAIELAAARVRHLSPKALLALLDHRFALLTGGPTDGPTRHHALRETIAWSDDLLEPDSQVRFRQLAVFRDAFDLDDAAAIWETDPYDALDTVSTLIDASLLTQRELGDAPRYDLLQTVRAYGWERLVASNEAEAAQDRHAAHFARVAARSAESLTRNGAPFLLDYLEACHDDLRAALTWYLRPDGDTVAALSLVASLPFFWYCRGFLNEGRTWLRRVLAADLSHGDRRPSDARAWARLGAGLLALVQGDYDDAQANLAASIAGWIDADDAWGVAVARSLLGGVYVSQGRYSQALPLFRSVSDAFRISDNQSWAAHVRFHLGAIAFATGDFASARAYLEDAVRMYDASGERIDGIDPVRYLALVACAEGDIAAATAALTDEFARLRERGSIAAYVPGIADAATLAVARSDFEGAAWLFGAAHRMRDQEGARPSLPAREVYERAEDLSWSELGDSEFVRASAAGATAPLPDILAAVKALLDTAIPAVSPLVAAATAAYAGLTEREMEVLRLLAAGRTNPEIAAALFISTGTARTHVSNILAKLDVKTRTEAAHVAHAQGLL